MKPDFKNLPQFYLHPGEVYYSDKDIIISTVLGSCIAIIMYSNSIPFSGISHCQLPVCREPKNKCMNCSNPYKYVDCTIRKMLQKFNSMNIPIHDIQIKVFGGADAFINASNTQKNTTVGSQNINSVLTIMNEYNLKIVASDVGGRQGRKIYFRSKTGEVFLRRIENYEKNTSTNRR